MQQNKKHFTCSTCAKLKKKAEENHFKLKSSNTEINNLVEENCYLRSIINGMERKIDELGNKLNKSLKSLEKIDLFEEKLNSILKYMGDYKFEKPNPSYADTAKTYPSKNVSLNSPNSLVLNIKPKKIQSSEETRKEIQQKINPVVEKASVEKVKHISKGGIVVKCTSIGDTKKLGKLTEEKLKKVYSVNISKLTKISINWQ